VFEALYGLDRLYRKDGATGDANKWQMEHDAKVFFENLGHIAQFFISKDGLFDKPAIGSCASEEIQDD
jgi:hypothetical protein